MDASKHTHLVGGIIVFGDADRKETGKIDQKAGLSSVIPVIIEILKNVLLINTSGELERQLILLLQRTTFST